MSLRRFGNFPSSESRLPTISPYDPQPKTSATPAATRSGSVKSLDDEINRPVTSGAKDPPTLPPKFCSDTNEETIWGGATSIGIAFTADVEKLKLATASVRKATARTVSGE